MKILTIRYCKPDRVTRLIASCGAKTATPVEYSFLNHFCFRWNLLGSVSLFLDGFRPSANVGKALRAIVRGYSARAKMGDIGMGVIPANLEKLRGLLHADWRFESINLHHLGASWRTTVVLKRGKTDLTLASDEDEFYRYCVAQRRFLDENGDPIFRRVVDTGRYADESKVFATEFDIRQKQAFERLKAGQLRLSFVPELLIAEFLKSRQWGDPKYLPLKEQYFDILAAIVWRGKDTPAAEQRFLATFPEAKPYAQRVGDVLRSAFDPLKDPLKNYLRFADQSRKSFNEVAKKLIDESTFNNDMLGRLFKDGSVEGQIGLRYLFDMYRRHTEWVIPLFKTLSDAICILEGKALPDPSLGMTKRVELIRQTAYADIVDCFDPRIRHAASHNGISYDQNQGIITFDGTDSDGVQKFDNFTLTYTEAADKTRSFIRGFIPGMLSAFGMQEQLILLTTITSGEYKRLLLLIGNEASD